MIEASIEADGADELIVMMDGWSRSGNKLHDSTAVNIFKFPKGRLKVASFKTDLIQQTTT